jgi:hypothetical protein
MQFHFQNYAMWLLTVIYSDHPVLAGHICRRHHSVWKNILFILDTDLVISV